MDDPALTAGTMHWVVLFDLVGGETFSNLAHGQKQSFVSHASVSAGGLELRSTNECFSTNKDSLSSCYLAKLML